MRLLLIIFLLAVFWATLLSGEHRTFALMTLASIGLLYFLPVFIRRHMAQIGTYVHEVCHGLTSLLTGGKFKWFRVGRQGGVCLTSGGNSKFITSSGYIGTVLFGAVFLAKSAQSNGTVTVLYLLALFLSLSTLKAGDPHTAVIGNIVAAALGIAEMLFPGSLTTKFLLNLMGVLLIWKGFEAIWELYRLSATEKDTGSDAEVMASVTGYSSMHWVLVFGGIALVIIILICGAALHITGR